MSSSNGYRPTVVLVMNRSVNQMAFSKPAIIFFYGIQEPMNDASVAAAPGDITGDVLS